MTFDTKAAAYASLREFTPAFRKLHNIVKFWSFTRNTWLYTRQFNPAQTATRFVTLPKPETAFSTPAL
jgi:hypothetical protein